MFTTPRRTASHWRVRLQREILLDSLPLAVVAGNHDSSSSPSSRTLTLERCGHTSFLTPERVPMTIRKHNYTQAQVGEPMSYWDTLENHR